MIVNYEVLQEVSTCPETLNVVELCQYPEGGLIHISNAAYSFFMLVEQEHVDRINTLKLAVLQKDMVNKSIHEVNASINTY